VAFIFPVRIILVEQYHQLYAIFMA